MSEQGDFTQLKDPAPDLFKDGNGDRLRIFLDTIRIKDLRVIRRLLTVREQIPACMLLLNDGSDWRGRA